MVSRRQRHSPRGAIGPFAFLFVSFAICGIGQLHRHEDPILDITDHSADNESREAGNYMPARSIPNSTREALQPKQLEVFPVDDEPIEFSELPDPPPEPILDDATAYRVLNVDPSRGENDQFYEQVQMARYFIGEDGKVRKGDIFTNRAEGWVYLYYGGRKSPMLPCVKKQLREDTFADVVSYCKRQLPSPYSDVVAQLDAND